MIKAIIDIYRVTANGKSWMLLGFCLLPIALLIDWVVFCSGQFVFLGILSTSFCIYAIYHGIHFKPYMRKDNYEQLILLQETTILQNNSNKYLKLLENDCDYLVLKELFSVLPGLRNNYAHEVLCTPLRLSQPVSPYTAAFWGTKLGGSAVGMLAALDTIEKQRKYEQNIRDVIASELNKGNALDKLQYCYSNIEVILNKNESVKKDWENEKNTIITKFSNQYKIYE